MASCDECKELVAATLTDLIVDGAVDDCAELAVEFGAACDLVGGGPEDPVADAVCGAAAVAIEVVCVEMTFEWIKNNIPEAAAMICKKIDIC